MTLTGCRNAIGCLRFHTIESVGSRRACLLAVLEELGKQELALAVISAHVKWLLATAHTESLNSRNAHQGSHCGTCGDADRTNCFDNDYPCRSTPRSVVARMQRRGVRFLRRLTVLLATCGDVWLTFFTLWDHARPFCGRLWNPALVKSANYLASVCTLIRCLRTENVIDCFKKWLEKCAAALRDHLIDNMGQSNLLLGILEDVLGTLLAVSTTASQRFAEAPSMQRIYCLLQLLHHFSVNAVEIDSARDLRIPPTGKEEPHGQIKSSSWCNITICRLCLYLIMVSIDGRGIEGADELHCQGAVRFLLRYPPGPCGDEGVLGNLRGLHGPRSGVQ